MFTTQLTATATKLATDFQSHCPLCPIPGAHLATAHLTEQQQKFGPQPCRSTSVKRYTFRPRWGSSAVPASEDGRLKYTCTAATAYQSSSASLDCATSGWYKYRCMSPCSRCRICVARRRYGPEVVRWRCSMPLQSPLHQSGHSKQHQLHHTAGKAPASRMRRSTCNYDIITSARPAQF